MICIRVIEAQNLPIFNGHSRKIIVTCQSYSSYGFYHGSFKSREKTENPKWNAEFKIELFRLIDLRFSLFGYRTNQNHFYIGEVNIHFNHFTSQPPGNQITNEDGTNVRYEFKVENCQNENASLSLMFSYKPFLYRPIEFKKSSGVNAYIHLWCNYSPSISDSTPKVDIELFQIIKMPVNVKGLRIGLAHVLDKSVSWESVGRSSLEKCFKDSTGLTQVHSLALPQISGMFSFFVLNVNDFSGKVSLNIVFEGKTKTKYIDSLLFIQPEEKKQLIGTLKSIDTNVQENKKYLIPFYIYYETNSTKANIFEFNHFGQDMPIFDKSKNTSTFDFYSQVIEKARSIPYLSKMQFLRTSILPNEETVSLSKMLRDYNLQQGSTFRFYVGGSTTFGAASYVLINYWHQYFIAYDKTTGQRCPEISEIYTSETPNNEPLKQSESFLPISMEWNSILTLNLDQFGKNIVYIFCINCRSDLQTAFPYGFFLISQLTNNNETPLFYNPVFVDGGICTCATFFRIEYLQNEWKIIPMKHYFRKKNVMEFCIDSMHSNNWILPPNIDRNNEFVKSAFKESDDEYIMNDNPEYI